MSVPISPSLPSCLRVPALVASSEANEVFNAIEDLPFPTVTAINGIALGGGFEMCLSTDYRVMAPKAKVGLPEVKLHFPGFGSTVRLSRLVGVDNAVEWIIGNFGRADAALKVGAVDAVVEADELVDIAVAIVNQYNEGKLDNLARREEKGKIKLNAMESMMAFEISGVRGRQGWQELSGASGSHRTMQKQPARLTTRRSK